MYDILKEINENTFLAENDGIVFILKKINVEETTLYKKIQKLNCKNIAKIIEFTIIDKEFYVVCEYVNGYNIRQYINRFGLFDELQTKQIVCGICDGLNELHKFGIIHRDINPSNIMLTENSEPKIIDFDISRIVKPNADKDTCILGTQCFAAPEQYGFSQSNEHTDIYSLGVLMNYMLTGCLPNEKMCKGELGRIINKCTQADEYKRYTDVCGLKFDLQGSNKFKRAVSYIPGFARGITYTTIAAIIYYIIAALLTISMYCVGDEASTGSDKLLSSLTFSAFIVPIPILGDSGSWSKKFILTRNLNKYKRFAVRLIFSLLTVLFLIIMCYTFMFD